MDGKTVQNFEDECYEVSDEWVVAENQDKCNDENLVKENEIVPEVGMKFKDVKEMFDFYKSYAYSKGFPVRKRNSKKGNDGIIRYVSFECSHGGNRNGNKSNSLKPRPTIQIGCTARITACSDVNGIWRINKVQLEHNHKTSPSNSRLYRCNRELSAQVKRRLEVNDLAEISLHKSFNSAVVEAGGYDQLTCIEKDCRNYVEKVRRLRLGEEDTAALQAYFSKMQANCPGFYFSMDLDEECRLKNVFWADNRCREAYKEFGDVVTFDTTYLTNNYDMPFALFVGVNHHGQSILLGCGLLSNEDTNTFVWLFKTWLQCMYNQAPNGIITDQDKAMQAAIEIVFPYTKHRWCLWHIFKKLPEKFGSHLCKGLILSTVHSVVYDSQSQDEFEHGWIAMVDKFDLHENSWLSELFANRNYWVPCFLKTTFWAGMSTTQRSEGMNAFFDGYVHFKTSLKQFVEQYERALRSKVEKEFQADFKSFSQMVPCATKYPIEKQFQKVYTIAKFKEFQEEFTSKVYCEVISSDVNCLMPRYDVREDVMVDGGVKKKMFTVLFQGETIEFVCSCHLFQFKGIVCRHAISVLIRNDVTEVPERYILKRWRKDVIRRHTRVAIDYDGWVSTPAQVRFDKMCTAFAKVADLAADDEEQVCGIMEWIESQTAQLSISQSIHGSRNYLHSQSSGHVAHDSQSSEPVPCENMLNSKCLRTKGALKKLRKKGPLEKSYQKSKAIKWTDGDKSRIQSNAQQNSLDGEGTQLTQSFQSVQYPTSWQH